MNVLPQNPDVIVIGAGAAGLSAAKALMNAGKTVTVLEAAARIGGRCITDTFANKPFDRGCSWLHSADINPLSKLAEEHGFKLHKKHWTYKKFMTGDRMLSDAELEAFKAYEDAMWDAVHEGVEKTGENSIEDLLPASPWRDGAKQWIPQLMSVDADASSAQDLVNHNDTYQDWLVEGGLGTLVAELHRDVPVTLNCRVLEIDTTGKDVRVVTSQGLVCAQKVVLTVSTGVLAADSIRFTPNLPDRKMTAISGLPCGLLNKIGLDFDPEWKEVHEGYMAGYQKNGEEFCTLLFGFFNTSLAIGFTAGRFGQALEKEGLGAATDFCLEGIKAMFGSEAVKYVRETTETAWMANELTFGSYSAALPGCSEARKVLAEPIDDRLYFAGEATMPQDFATVHGAYQSGIRVAEEICSASK